MTVQYHKIGTTYGGMVNVETLSATPNMGPGSNGQGAHVIPYSELIQTSARTYVTRGAPYVDWYWGFMPLDLYNALRVICPGASASVFIDTLKEDMTTYEHYSGTMVWPDATALEYRGGRYQNVTIRIQNLVVYVP